MWISKRTDYATRAVLMLVRTKIYDLTADGMSLDDKRTPLLPEAKFGARPSEPLNADEHLKNNLPDALDCWRERDGSSIGNGPTSRSTCRRPTSSHPTTI